MTRADIRDTLAFIIGNALGIGGAFWLFEYSTIESKYIVFPSIALCPYVSALVTGLLASRNERALAGITVLVVTLGMFVILGFLSTRSNFWMRFMTWGRFEAVVAGVCIIGLYTLGRQVGYLAIKLKGKRIVEQGTGPHFNKKK